MGDLNLNSGPRIGRGRGGHPEFVHVLQDLKERGVIDKGLYKMLYPTTDESPRFYGLPKLHKADMPLQPIVRSIRTIYECACYLGTVLSLLIGKTEHHVKNSSVFVKEVWEIKLEPDELQSYDMSVLFMSVPIDKVLEVIKAKLKEDNTLSEETPLEPDI